MALYRSLASPGVPARLLLIVGLLLLTISQALATPSATASPVAVLGLIGGLCVLLFVIAGMLRHYRALFRIRREEPTAWQPTLSFALASLAVPLGFSGPAGSPRDRLLRRITLVLVLAYAVTTIIALGRR
jgi:Ca2+/H+ antiporter